jgi:hypothetical protein
MHGTAVKAAGAFHSGGRKACSGWKVASTSSRMAAVVAIGGDPAQESPAHPAW